MARTLALFLSLILAVPNSAFALRTIQPAQNPKTVEAITVGLEEEGKAIHKDGSSTENGRRIWTAQKVLAITGEGLRSQGSAFLRPKNILSPEQRATPLGRDVYRVYSAVETNRSIPELPTWRDVLLSHRLDPEVVYQRAAPPIDVARQLLKGLARDHRAGLVVLSQVQAGRDYLGSRRPISVDRIERINDLLADALYPTAPPQVDRSMGYALWNTEEARSLRERGVIGFVLVDESLNNSRVFYPATIAGRVLEALSRDSTRARLIDLNYSQFRELLPSPRPKNEYLADHPEFLEEIHDILRAAVGRISPKREEDLIGYLLWAGSPAQKLRRRGVSDIEIFREDFSYDVKAVASNLLQRVADDLRRNPRAFSRYVRKDRELHLPYSFVDRLGALYPTKSALRQSKSLCFGINEALEARFREASHQQTHGEDPIQVFLQHGIEHVRVVRGARWRDPSLEAEPLARRLLELIPGAIAKGVVPRNGPILTLSNRAVAGVFDNSRTVASYLSKRPELEPEMNKIIGEIFQGTLPSLVTSPDGDSLRQTVQQLQSQGVQSVVIQKAGSNGAAGMEENKRWTTFRHLLREAWVGPDAQRAEDRLLHDFGSYSRGMGGVEIEVPIQALSPWSRIALFEVPLPSGGKKQIGMSFPKRLPGKRVRFLPVKNFEGKLVLQVFEVETGNFLRQYGWQTDPPGLVRFGKRRQEQLHNLPRVPMPLSFPVMESDQSYDLGGLSDASLVPLPYLEELDSRGYLYRDSQGRIPGALALLIRDIYWRTDRVEYPISYLVDVLGKNKSAVSRLVRKAGVPLIKRRGEPARLSRESVLEIVLLRRIREWVRYEVGGVMPFNMAARQLGFERWVIREYRGAVPVFAGVPLWIEQDGRRFVTRRGFEAALREKAQRPKRGYEADLFEAVGKRLKRADGPARGRLFLEAFRAVQELGIPYLETPSVFVPEQMQVRLSPRRLEEVFREAEHPTPWTADRIVPDRKYGTAAACRVFGTSISYVALLIKNGQLSTRKEFGRHWIKGSEILRWLEVRRSKGLKVGAGLEEGPISRIATAPADSAILAITFSSDGKVLVFASGHKLGKFAREIHLFTVATGKTIVVPTDHTDTISALGFSPDGRLLASLDFSGNLLLWETQRLLQGGHPEPIIKWKVAEPLKGAENIQAFAFSPDGRTLAAGSTYGRIFLFGLDGTPGIPMKEVGRLAVSKDPNFNDYVRDLAFGPDSSSLVVVLQNGSVFFGDIQTQKLNLLFEHPRGLYAMALSPDGATLAITDHDWRIYLYDSHTGRLKQKLDGHWDNVNVLGFSPDSRLLVSGGKDGALRVVDVTTSKVIEVLRMSMIPDVGAGFINGVAFSPDGKTLAVASGHVTSGWSVWTWKVGVPVRRPPSLWRGMLQNYRNVFHEYSAKSLWDEQVAYLWRELQEISGQDLEANQNAFWEGLVQGPEDRAMAARVLQRLRQEEPLKPFAPSFEALVSSHLAGLEEGKVLTGHSLFVRSVAFSPDGAYLVSGEENRALKLWEASTGKLIWTYQTSSEPAYKKGVSGVAFSPDGNYIAAVLFDGTVLLIDPKTGNKKEERNFIQRVPAIAYSPDGNTIATGGTNGVQLWDGSLKDPNPRLKLNRGEVYSLAFHPDGKRLVVGDFGKSVLLEIQTDRLVSVRDFRSGSQAGVNAVVFSPDGNTMASGDSKGSVGLWEVSTGRELKVFDVGNGFSVRSVAFSPDGKKLVTGGVDEAVRIWDIDSGRLLQKLTGHTGIVHAVAVNSHGSLIASGSADRMVRLWNLPAVSGVGQEERTTGITGPAGIQMRLERIYGSTEEFYRFARGIREFAQVQQQPVAIFFDPNLVAGDNPLSKAMHLINLEGNLQGVLRWKEQIPLAFEISSPERIQQLLSRGYRAIQVAPQGSAGLLPDQGLLLAAANAYHAALVARSYPNELFTFFLDIKLYQGFGELDYPTFVVTLQELLEAA